MRDPSESANVSINASWLDIVQQGLLFVLTMDVEQAWRQFAQRRYSARLVVDVNAISIVGRNLAADDDLGTFAVKTEAFEFGIDVGLEDGFDDGAVFAATDHFRRWLCEPASRPSASTMMDFPAPVSPDKRLKPSSKVKFELIDESEISNAKKTQHTRLGVISHRGLIFQ